MDFSVGSIGKIASNTIVQNKDKKVEAGSFDDFLKQALNFVEETNQLQKDAQQASVDFAVGKTEDIHNVMIAQEKANIALQFTVQLRNKLLEAYQEIMRMPI